MKLTERLIELSGIPDHASIADLGCGNGIVCDFLHHKEFQATGIDQEIRFRKSEDIGFVQGNFHNLPLSTNFFDAVMMECVLSIQDDPSAGLSEAHRILKQSGLLLLSDLYLQSDQDNSYRLHTKNLYLEVIQKAGFQIILWEDHTRELRNLIFEILWEQVLTESFCISNGQHGIKGSKNLGYFILIGRKNAQSCI